MALEFDLNKTFDQNTAEFRKHLEQLDPECAAIFFNNLDVLTGDSDPERARARRTAFNAGVAAALDALPDEDIGTP